MKVTIVFDNTSKQTDLKEEWGFACFIETESRRILFDTGADGKILLENMQKLAIDPKSIDDIFISHNHFDHIGGLSSILNENSDLTIFLPKSLLGVRNAKEIIQIDKARQIGNGLFTTGELEGIEQSLIVETTKGLVVIVGCSHPEMKTILDAASHFGEVYGIIGGLHGFKRFELFKDLGLICPTHCTQHKTEIKKLYPKQYVEGGVGKSFTIS
jgi:7,8-dihydropterin-6-yl-methyl-4-(beta-D-ribofuranosyl)aminobenzene 5'-phosphate synthase